MLRSLLLYILFLHATNVSAQNLAGNIFIKTDVSSTNCFVGEPVVVTFTLFLLHLLLLQDKDLLHFMVSV